MLTDLQLERYSRQVLLPEVGGRGQERLLESTVTLAGDCEAAGVAVTLLGRAGVGRLALVGAGPSLPELSPDCRVERHRAALGAPLGAVVVDFGTDAAGAAILGRRAAAGGLPFVCTTRTRTGATLLTLVGRPCFACVPAGVVAAPPEDDGTSPLGAPLPLLLGALAAAEVLRLLLAPAGRGRLHRVGLAGTGVEAVELSPTAGCTLCGGTA